MVKGGQEGDGEEGTIQTNFRSCKQKLIVMLRTGIRSYITCKQINF